MRTLQGFGFRVLRLEFRVWGSGFLRSLGQGQRVSGLVFDLKLSIRSLYSM